MAAALSPSAACPRVLARPRQGLRRLANRLHQHLPSPCHRRASASCHGGQEIRTRTSGQRSANPTSEEAPQQRAPAAVAAAAAAILAASVATPAFSADSTVIAEFNASGLFIKDSVEVVALTDPLVDGVTLYLSDFKRSITAKLQSSDFFSEPSQTSLACVRNEMSPDGSSGAVRVKADLGGREGKEMFAERKNLNLLNNKTLRVRRIFHPEANSIVYVSYSTRTASAGKSDGPSAGQYKTSLCAVPLRPGEGTVTPDVK
uniref:Uncharacterized protein n=1 Tax=Mantoniella antarctica TaxID=81844 RepID=A0A7S0X505_9CHLO|mmetsp:Transcript_13995/g.33881  ORF Transcript_13995/g.33881 Transcript_13995/m.33881 type:complete len:260 (+) Transcript_13995:18-797(+)